ncbi:MAG: PRC-barrel domain-containing protein [Nanoarchaeota archaeon]
MLKVKKMTQIYDMKVFTDTGEYFGDIEEGIIQSNKVFGWRVKATRNSTLNKILGGAKGVIVPHKFVKAVGDIMLISRQAIPSYKDESEEGEHQQIVQE